VVFTDESAFRLRFQGRRKVWKLFGEVGNPAILSGTLKTQRKVNVSGGLTAHGVTPLINIEGIMNDPKQDMVLPARQRSQTHGKNCEVLPGRQEDTNY